MADDSFKHQVLEATDIVELISQTVSLKRRGSKYIGLCPFHQEKTPSFNVDPVKKFFKCFGCKEGGNAIDFVIKRDRIDFLEALKQLAERAGLEMPKFGISKQKSGEKQQLLDIHARAADFYHRNLLHPELGKPARDYLASRGFSDETIRAFKIGYAPPGWDNLLRCRDLQGTPPGMMALGGLLKAREGGGHYDAFRNRLMFPIRDELGRTIAFGGRVMPGSDDPAKYLNSPETPLFSKSKSIFGIDLARPRIIETRTVAICEGYTDVAMAHQFGASNVVSILGTAMTEGHLGVLRRFADRIVLLFDADTAGEMAVNRAVELFLTQPVEIAIATIPEDLDPDEYLMKRGPEAFEGLLKSSEDALDFKWKLLRRELEAAGGSLTGQQRAVESYLALLAGARGTGPVDPIRWGAVLRRVETHTGIPMAQLTARFGAMGGSPPPSPGSRPPFRPRAQQGSYQGPRRGPGQGFERGYERGQGSRPASRQGFREGGREGVRGSGEGYGARPGLNEQFVNSPQNRGESSVPVWQDGPDAGVRAALPESRLKAERWILGILLADPSRWVHVQTQVGPDNFAHPPHRRLAEFYWDRLRDEGEAPFHELLSELPDEETKQISMDLVEESEKLPNLEATLQEALGEIISEKVKLEEAQLLAVIRRKDATEQEVTAAFRRLSEIRRNPDFRRGA